MMARPVTYGNGHGRASVLVPMPRLLGGLSGLDGQSVPDDVDDDVCRGDFHTEGHVDPTAFDQRRGAQTDERPGGRGCLLPRKGGGNRKREVTGPGNDITFAGGSRRGNRRENGIGLLGDATCTANGNLASHAVGQWGTSRRKTAVIQAAQGTRYEEAGNGLRRGTWGVEAEAEKSTSDTSGNSRNSHLFNLHELSSQLYAATTRTRSGYIMFSACGRQNRDCSGEVYHG